MSRCRFLLDCVLPRVDSGMMAALKDILVHLSTVEFPVDSPIRTFDKLSQRLEDLTELQNRKKNGVPENHDRLRLMAPLFKSTRSKPTRSERKRAERVAASEERATKRAAEMQAIVDKISVIRGQNVIALHTNGLLQQCRTAKSELIRTIKLMARGLVLMDVTPTEMDPAPNREMSERMVERLKHESEPSMDETNVYCHYPGCVVRTDCHGHGPAMRPRQCCKAQPGWARRDEVVSHYCNDHVSSNMCPACEGDLTRLRAMML